MTIPLYRAFVSVVDPRRGEVVIAWDEWSFDPIPDATTTQTGGRFETVKAGGTFPLPLAMGPGAKLVRPGSGPPRLSWWACVSGLDAGTVGRMLEDGRGEAKGLRLADTGRVVVDILACRECPSSDLPRAHDLACRPIDRAMCEAIQAPAGRFGIAFGPDEPGRCFVFDGPDGRVVASCGPGCREWASEAEARAFVAERGWSDGAWSGDGWKLAAFVVDLGAGPAARREERASEAEGPRTQTAFAWAS